MSGSRACRVFSTYKPKMYSILEKPGHSQLLVPCFRPATAALAVPARAMIEATCIFVVPLVVIKGESV